MELFYFFNLLLLWYYIKVKNLIGLWDIDGLAA